MGVIHQLMAEVGPIKEVRGERDMLIRGALLEESFMMVATLMLLRRDGLTASLVLRIHLQDI